MPKTHTIDLVRYEYMVYIYLLETYNISEILLTKEDFVDMNSVSDEITWIPVENMNIDIVETAGATGKNSEVPVSKSKNRICGLFDAEPLDWKYAKVTVDDDTNTKHNFAIAKVPRSPIMPIIFEINE